MHQPSIANFFYNPIKFKFFIIIIKRYTCKRDGLFIDLIFFKISLILDLLDGFFASRVEFKFENVYSLFCYKCKVYSAHTCVDFRLNV